MSEFATAGQFVVRMDESIKVDGYRYHVGQVISMGTLRQIMEEYCEVKVTIIQLQ